MKKNYYQKNPNTFEEKQHQQEDRRITTTSNRVKNHSQPKKNEILINNNKETKKSTPTSTPVSSSSSSFPPSSFHPGRIFPSIPIELYRIIQPFCTLSSYESFLTTTKAYDFPLIRYETHQIHLNGKDLREYLLKEKKTGLSSPFYRRIHERVIKNPLYQLIVSEEPPPYSYSSSASSSSSSKVSSSSLFPSTNPTSTDRDLAYQFLQLPCCKLIMKTENYRGLGDFFIPFLYWEEFILCNKQELSLTHFSRIKNWNSLASLLQTRISKRQQDIPLQKMELIDLPNLEDISCFSFLQELILCNCPKIIQINHLKTISKLLSIQECHGIVDISELGNIPKLSLIQNNGLTSLQGLNKNQSLTILNCPNILQDGFISLSHVKELITDLIHIEDDLREFNLIGLHSLTLIDYQSERLPLSNSQRLQRLTLKKCPTIRSLEEDTFTRLTTLHVVNCPNFELVVEPTVNFLQNPRLKSLTINNCERFQNFSGIQNFLIPKVILSSMTLPSLKFFSDVQHLKISNCTFTAPPDWKSISHLMSLEISDCYWLQRLDDPSLKFIPYVTIGSCKALQTIDGLGQNQRIVLSASSKSLFEKSLLKKTMKLEKSTNDTITLINRIPEQRLNSSQR